MTTYELMVISADGEAAFGKIDKFLKDVDALNVKTEKLGKKQLAYPISKLTEADYTVYRFDAEGTAISELAGRMRLEQEIILRHLLIKYDPRVEKSKKVSTPEEKPEVKATAKVTVTTQGKSEKKEEKAAGAKKVKAEKPKKEKKEVKKAAKAAKKGKK